MNRDVLISLSEEILEDFELSRLPLGNVVYKCLRLCRLLQDDIGLKLFRCEAEGYERDTSGHVIKEQRDIAHDYAGRAGLGNKKEDGTYERVVFTDSINELEGFIVAEKIRLESAKDPNISLTSANPNQYLFNPNGNKAERNNAVNQIRIAENKLGKIKGALYSYILNINYKLKYEDVFTTIFDKNREKTYEKLSKICPDVLKEFDSIYNGLHSNNEIDIANCVHTCRRILKTVADYLYPSSSEKVCIDGESLDVSNEKYINRLIAFISSKTSSKTYSQVVCSSIEDISSKLHAIYNASCKGSHDNVSRFEAERYVIYTYLFLGDIVSLID